MLGITQYLACHGLSLAAIEGYLRPLDAQESLLLVGSVGEGLANVDSDLDLLLLASDSRKDQHSAHSDVLRSMPAGFDLNVEIVTLARAESLCRRFLQSFEEARRPWSGQASRALSFMGADELRLLHRLRTGIPLLGSSPSVEALRQAYQLHMLPDFCILQHVACHLRLRADAAQAVLDSGDPYTPLLMCQLATQHLIAALLASVGETNPSPKWALRLLRDHRASLAAFEPEALIRLALPGTAAGARELVDELVVVSGRSLADLAAAAQRGKSPLAAALGDLLPAQAPIMPSAHLAYAR